MSNLSQQAMNLIQVAAKVRVKPHTRHSKAGRVFNVNGFERKGKPGVRPVSVYRGNHGDAIGWASDMEGVGLPYQIRQGKRGTDIMLHPHHLPIAIREYRRKGLDDSAEYMSSLLPKKK